MAHYKHVDTSARFLPVDRALLPGTSEHAQIGEGCAVGVPSVSSAEPLL
jgi:hypothetical protein